MTLALAGLVAALAGCKPVPEASGVPAPSASAVAVRADLPSSMAALGDSLTVGFGSCFALVSCPRNSWATGDGLMVNSHYKRILAGNPAIRGHADNFGAAGATVADLAAQARQAVSRHPAYVTVLIGANDACRSRIEDMTSTADFTARLRAALDILRTGLPDARVLVVSIPDVYQVWQVAHTSRTAQDMWRLGACPALLANPTSMAAADVSRRARFRDQIDAYDRILASACAAYGHRCRYDGGAAHRVAFGVDLLSVLDFFHPNAAGQDDLARVTYPGTFTW